MLLMSLSCVSLGAGMGFAAFVPWPATLASVVSIALGIVLLLPIAATVVSRLAPVELRGRYMGMWTIVYMGGYAIGPLIGGWALDALGGRLAFAPSLPSASQARHCSRCCAEVCEKDGGARRSPRLRRRSAASCSASVRSRPARRRILRPLVAASPPLELPRAATDDTAGGGAAGGDGAQAQPVRRGASSAGPARRRR